MRAACAHDGVLESQRPATAGGADELVHGGGEMLQLRVYGASEAMAAVADRIDALAGAHHVSLVEGARGRSTLVTADLRSDGADRALASLQELGVPVEDLALVRLDPIGRPNESSALVLVWRTCSARRAPVPRPGFGTSSSWPWPG
jgi:hypothetical protein